MTFISYAENFEDVALWRMFRICVDAGFYIDVGANDPTAHSVTRAFYDRGWRGINVDPSPDFHQRLCAERPRDINLQAAVSDSEGQLTFFDCGGELSTVDSRIAAELKRDGRHVVERVIPATTLRAICEQYAAGEIHFLKIDVEGHESAVLRGMDFIRWRPWILLIEAPFNIEPEWRQLVEAARYREVRCDGINRYFLAEEHLNLEGAFDLPPSALDDFQFCYGHHFSYPVAEMEAQLAYERSRADAAEAKLGAAGGDFCARIRSLAREPRKWAERLKRR